MSICVNRKRKICINCKFTSFSTNIKYFTNNLSRLLIKIDLRHQRAGAVQRNHDRRCNVIMLDGAT